jgi:hypothetical protein
VGGRDLGDAIVNTAEIYDPKTGRFSETGAPSLPRSVASVTLLANGKVLIAGGGDTYGVKTYDSAEIYDPATGSFSPTGSMTSPRKGHAAALLPSGDVLVAGGYVNSPGSSKNTVNDSAELYRP